MSVLVSSCDQLLFAPGVLPSAFQVLSNPVLLVVLVFSQEGSIEVTLCILVDPSNTACYRLNDGGENDMRLAMMLLTMFTAKVQGSVKLQISIKTPE